VVVGPVATEHWFDRAKAPVVQKISAQAAIDFEAKAVGQRLNADDMMQLNRDESACGRKLG